MDPPRAAQRLPGGERSDSPRLPARSAGSSAAEAVKQADELAKLARKDPKDLSPEEFDRILN
ncbi:hypothetical protein, partial [Rhodococcus jostii]|uniref:hypothetical protein n=1 Tax=Rhodococcus jostii TaxID=132919 RepID=UPI00365BEB3D